MSNLGVVVPGVGFHGLCVGIAFVAIKNCIDFLILRMSVLKPGYRISPDILYLVLVERGLLFDERPGPS
jgi:hypothetical protein